MTSTKKISFGDLSGREAARLYKEWLYLANQQPYQLDQNKYDIGSFFTKAEPNHVLKTGDLFCHSISERTRILHIVKSFQLTRMRQGVKEKYVKIITKGKTFQEDLIGDIQNDANTGQQTVQINVSIHSSLLFLRREVYETYDHFLESERNLARMVNPEEENRSLIHDTINNTNIASGVYDMLVHKPKPREKRQWLEQSQRDLPRKTGGRGKTVRTKHRRASSHLRLKDVPSFRTSSRLRRSKSQLVKRR